MAALEALGTADVLAHLVRDRPWFLKTLRRVSPSLLPAVHQAALAVLTETKTSFERLLQSLPKVRMAELRRLNYTFDGPHTDDEEGWPQEIDEEDEDWHRAAAAFDEATRQLQAHQEVVIEAHALLKKLVCICFEPAARDLIHAGAITLLIFAWDAEWLEDSLPVMSQPEFELTVCDHKEWEENEPPITKLINGRQKVTDILAMRARFGMGAPKLDGFIDSSWLAWAPSVAARKRAGLAAPRGCYTLKRLADEAPGVLDRARRAAWRSLHGAHAKARKASWLARGLRQLGLEPRADSAKQRECVASPFESMGDEVGETLRTAVWMNWLHNHTQGRYKRAVDNQAKASASAYHYDYSDSDSDEYLYSQFGPRRGRGGYGGGTDYREAVDSMQAMPEFQMPTTIPWLPAPGNNTGKAVLEATRVVRTYIRWGRAFLRVRALVALRRPSSATPSA
jgi:hypothetical protein